MELRLGRLRVGQAGPHRPRRRSRRHLFYDIYLVQQIDLCHEQAHAPVRDLARASEHAVLEFQNDANATVRISRLVH